MSKQTRTILSIDVGIKNLSFCLFQIGKENQIKVLKWDNIDLTKQDDIGSKCIYIEGSNDINLKKTKTKKTKKTDVKESLAKTEAEVCNKPAKFIKDGKCYCLKHSKLTNFLQPIAELKQSFLNKQKQQNLLDLAIKYKLISIDDTSSYKKAELTEMLNNYSKNNCFLHVEKGNAAKIDLVTIGRNIQHRFDEILCDYLLTIDTIIIENQIGPIANKMKTIQGMLSQYFIMKNNNISVDFISATNKLKDFVDKTVKMDYKERKKLGVQTCSNFVLNDDQFSEWSTFFAKHQKKDDLSDCFLQGLWYIKHIIK